MIHEPVRHDTMCRLCGSSRITTVFALKPTPPEDSFVRQEETRIPQPTTPLDLALCESCGYLHLAHIRSPEGFCANYCEVTNADSCVGRNPLDDVKRMVASAGTTAGSLVVGVRGSDPTLSEAFEQLGMHVVGVEPARRSMESPKHREVVPQVALFGPQLAELFVRNSASASLVTAHYVYANIDDVLGFTRAVASVLVPDGAFIVRTGYHPEQMKRNMFDYIYHDHCSYFSAKVLRDLFGRCGLELIDVQKIAPKGGSIQAVARLAGDSRRVSSRVVELIEEEESTGVHEAETYKSFALEIERIKGEVLDLLDSLKRRGKRIVGYGASHSTTTLTYHFELARFLDYIVDDNPRKHGLFSPGYHLRVYPVDRLYVDRPDYAIVLAWQHQGTIMSRNQRFLDEGGRFVVPLPELRVI